MNDRAYIHIDQDYRFYLKQVSWGYRHTHAYVLERLSGAGVIGRCAPGVTETLLRFLDDAAELHFGEGARDLLLALDQRHRWLMRLPDLFEQLCDTALQLARTHRPIASRLLRHWHEGRFGVEPDRLAHLLQLLGRLTQIDPQLAAALMEGYPVLIERLAPAQVDRFVEQLGPIHRRRPQTACDHAAVRLRSAHIAVDDLAEEARLDDLRPRLTRLVRAVAGCDVQIEPISRLDSDHLIDRGSTVVCFDGHLYLPERVVGFGGREVHESTYRVAALVAAATLRWHSFACRHGWPLGPSTLTQWCAGDPVWSAATWLIELQRLTQRLGRWPGAARLLRDAIDREFMHRPVVSRTDRLVRDLLTHTDEPDPSIRAIRAAAAGVATIDAARERGRDLADLLRRVLDGPIRAMHWFADFDYPAGFDASPRDDHDRADHEDRADRPADPDRRPTDQRPGMGAPPDDPARESRPDTLAFAYPEWSEPAGEYLEDWCLVRELRPEPAGDDATLDASPPQATARVRRMFERLKPDLIRKQKRLLDGDQINHEQLVDYLSEPGDRRTGAPRVYERQLIRRRDLAVALLLDISGSTGTLPDGSTCLPGDPNESRRIIALERSAAALLAEGLTVLGDTFAVYGFSGRGRERCEFHIYKAFDEPYDDSRRARLAAARPVSNTRIGPALRHARRRLADQPARRRLILLITDGQPQDSQYDGAGGYAQHDVRAACLEALRDDIKTVCISAADHDPDDLSVMFPGRRFVTLRTMDELIRRLPQLYLRMTR
jgi:hypothetical protein